MSSDTCCDVPSRTEQRGRQSVLLARGPPVKSEMVAEVVNERKELQSEIHAKPSPKRLELRWADIINYPRQ